MLISIVKSVSSLGQIPGGLDGIEFRLDYFPELNIPKTDLPRVGEAMKRLQMPVLLTLRKASHGGHFKEDELRRKYLIEKLLEYKPAFVDLEYDTNPAFFEKVKTNYPDVKIICSYHNFDRTPHDLEAVFKMMPPGCWGYKIAVMANCAIDSLRMLHFLKRKQKLGST